MATTPPFRVSYAHVFEPQKNDLNGEMEYSLVGIFPKGTDFTQMKADAEAALVKKFGSNKANWPENLRSPFRKCKERWKTKDGKQIIPAGYEDPDATFITFKQNAKRGRPALVNEQVQDITEQKDFYSGCWAIAAYNAYGYDNKGNRGASFGLNGAQKLRNDEPLGGTFIPTKEFKPVEGAAPADGAGAKSIFDDD